jgi:rubrerythrin
MGMILVVDTVGDVLPTLQPALTEAGFEVVVETALECCLAPADAIILATDAAGLAQSLKQVQAVREGSGTPVILVAELDRSGWDRTFSAPEALSADALFDKPLDTPALLRRLQGIVAARAEAQSVPAAPGMDAILDQAVGNEEAAAAFYRYAASRSSRPETREALEALARDEEEHERLLEEFRSGAHPLPGTAPGGGSIVETFGTPAFSPDMTPADAFLLAAHKERLAVETYTNWAALYPEGPERELLLGLAGVERRHKEHVEGMFSNAAFPEAW